MSYHGAPALQPRGSGEVSAARASPWGVVRERTGDLGRGGGGGGRAEANSEAAGDEGITQAASTEQSLLGPERV